MQYEDLKLEQVKALAEYGHTDSYMASFFGVYKSTWDRWKKQYPEFGEAVELWGKVATGRVQKALFELAVGYTYKTQKAFMHKATGLVQVVDVVETVPPSPSACMFWLERREREDWGVKAVIEHEGKVEHDHKHRAVPDEELEDRIFEIAAEAAEERVNQIGFGKDLENALR